jgi:hypothetical protein
MSDDAWEESTPSDDDDAATPFDRDAGFPKERPDNDPYPSDPPGDEPVAEL